MHINLLVQVIKMNLFIEKLSLKEITLIPSWEKFHFSILFLFILKINTIK